MNQNILNFIHKMFNNLIENFQLSLITELNDDNYYSISYKSKDFIIKIEKYRREFYTYLYKINYPEEGINLFNLFDFLYKDYEIAPVAKYFRDEIDLDECYKKQIAYIEEMINGNFLKISDFFKKDHYELNKKDFDKYWKKKHPEFYPKSID